MTKGMGNFCVRGVGRLIVNHRVLVIRGTEYALNYSHPSGQHLLLEGKLQADLLSVRLRKVDPSTFLLVSRGFHWINEFPFNR